MNFVLILVDTQSKSMVGVYGNQAVDTPNLDRLAATGIRFECAYTASPVCTPTRSAIFSGIYPQVNGAWCNNVAPQASIPLMGAIFRHYGFRAGYTGKWHLDGSNYFGDGEAGGGFESDWWYDGKRYAEDIGPEMFRRYIQCETAKELRQEEFTEAFIWGHRVADRAIDFLNRVEDAPFVLAVSFDEPHEPHVAPPEYWEKFKPEDIPYRPNFNASVTNKPALQQVQRRQNENPDWLDVASRQVKLYGCNSYIDREIGRVICAVEESHGDDTCIIYTSDHGDMLGGHGLRSKGPMMYEEICNVPFIVRLPDAAAGSVSHALVSHLDIMPTMLELAGIEIPDSLQGMSFAPVLHNPEVRVRDHVFVSFTRFAINHDQYGGFYPIRCITDDRYKLAVNLFDTDELYDLAEDPYETINLIDDPAYANTRNRLHAELLEEMGRIRDPFRTFRWGNRSWNTIQEPFYWGGMNRKLPRGFPFQPSVLRWTP